MLRDYQQPAVQKAFKILTEFKIVYLNAEMRTGKTTMALTLADMVSAKNVLFVTPKKVVTNKDVENDYQREGFTYKLTVINYEQLDKLNEKFDLVIADEANKFGAFPKPAIRTKRMKWIVGDAYLILMSGTAYPESASQLFFQFGLSRNSPFANYKNFYKWAYDFVKVKQVKLKGVTINDYKDADVEKIMAVVGKYFVKVTQEEAGFKVYEVSEEIIEIPVDPRIYKLINKLLKDKMYTLKNGDNIICDTPATLRTKVHQLFSGTIKTDTDYYILDTTKAEFIRRSYENKRIVIFYKYIAEGEALQSMFQGEYTDSPNLFNTGKRRVFISQLQSGSTGINLSSADITIFYNIDYSYVQYAQARDRIKSLERDRPAIVHWLFAKDGIEKKIFNVVQKKKDYNSYYFKKDFNIN